MEITGDNEMTFWQFVSDYASLIAVLALSIAVTVLAVEVMQ